MGCLRATGYKQAFDLYYDGVDKVLAAGTLTGGLGGLALDKIPQINTPRLARSLKGIGGALGVALGAKKLFDLGQEAFVSPQTRKRVDLLMHDGKGNVLLQKQRGRIDFPGGGIDKGQNASGAAEREALEEVGLRAKNVRQLGIRPSTFKWWASAPRRTNSKGKEYTHLRNYVRAAEVGGVDKSLYGSEGDALRRAKFVPFAKAMELLEREAATVGEGNDGHAKHKMKALRALASLQGTKLGMEIDKVDLGLASGYLGGRVGESMLDRMANKLHAYDYYGRTYKLRERYLRNALRDVTARIGSTAKDAGPDAKTKKVIRDIIRRSYMPHATQFNKDLKETLQLQKNLQTKTPWYTKRLHRANYRPDDLRSLGGTIRGLGTLAGVGFLGKKTLDLLHGD